MIVLVLLLITIALMPTLCSTNIFLDAGSSGTRCQIYYPVNVMDCGVQLYPGVTSLLHSSKDEVKAYFAPMKEWIFNNLPRDLTIRFKIMGTAGFRMYNAHDISIIWVKVKEELTTWGDFDIEARTISGQEEGVWVFVSANKLLNQFPEKPWAVLDMGNMSTQITFATESIPLDGHFKFMVKDSGLEKKFDVYTRRYMGFGHGHAFKKILDNAPLEFPCLFSGFTIKRQEKTYVGTANIQKCYDLVMEFFRDNVECNYNSCSIYGNYMPSIPNDMNLLLISGFAYNADYVACYGKQKVECLYFNAKQLFEGKTEQEAKLLRKDKLEISDEKFLYMSIFNSVYDYLLLTKVYHVEPTRLVNFGAKVDGVFVSHLHGSLYTE